MDKHEMTFAEILETVEPVQDSLDPVTRSEVDRARSSAGHPHGNPKAYKRHPKHKGKEY